MDNINEELKERLQKAIIQKNPLFVAVTCCEAMREKKLFKKLKRNEEEKKIKELISKSIVAMKEILKKAKWKEENINEFEEHLKRFVKEI